MFCPSRFHKPIFFCFRQLIHFDLKFATAGIEIKVFGRCTDPGTRVCRTPERTTDCPIDCELSAGAPG